MSEAIDRVHYLFAFKTLISPLCHKTLIDVTDVILCWRQYLRSAVVVKSLDTLVKNLNIMADLKSSDF